MGVRRAVDAAAGALKDSAGEVCTLGPLIHNPQVLDALEAQGIHILEEQSLPPTLNGATVILRAHGVPPRTEAELLRLGARVVDATCPRVKASQMKARSFAERGYTLVLAGEEHHGEVAGIQGYAPLCVIVGNAAEAERAAAELFDTNPRAKTALIGQTTITPAEYDAIAGAVKRRFPRVEIVDSICAAATDRQESLRELCAQVDGVIVVGGRASANTRRLLDIAAALMSARGKTAWLAETPADIPPEAAHCRVMGLAAGASTPDAAIAAIETHLRSWQITDNR
jgi:4-hydroxy-3-methylbut-2-enyl diphosphate reductase